MGSNHIALLRALIAAQAAVIEHADEDVAEGKAKAFLLERLAQATKLAKKLDT